MSTLHGSWIKKQEQSYLLIWGETWRSTSLQLSSAELVDESVPWHPFILNQSELIDLLRCQDLKFAPKAEEQWTRQIIDSPSTTIKKENRYSLSIFSIRAK